MENFIEKNLLYSLTINGFKTQDIGLLHGKMGIVLTFYHYYLYTQNRIYEETADRLLDDIWDNIYDDFPENFSHGLCGVGWGIEYLIKKGFIEADRNDICNIIDIKIREKDIRRIQDYTLQSGLEGICHYILARLDRNNPGTELDPMFLNDISNAIYKHSNASLNPVFKMFIDYMQFRESINYTYTPFSFIKENNSIEDILRKNRSGLYDGVAGYILKMINTDEKE